MSGRQHTSVDRQRAHRAGQQSIRRRCTCGRILVGNAAWASHQAAAERHGTTDEHGWQGRA